MKKDKSAAAAKLSEEELLSQIAKREKREDNLKYYGIIGTVIGVIGTIISMALELSLLGLIFMVVVIVSIISVFLGGRTRKKAEKLVDTQLDDFFESDLDGPSAPAQIPRRCPSTSRFWTSSIRWRSTGTGAGCGAFMRAIITELTSLPLMRSYIT